MQKIDPLPLRYSLKALSSDQKDHHISTKGPQHPN